MEGLRDLPKGTQLMCSPVKMIPGCLGSFQPGIISKTGSEAGQTQRRHLGCRNGRKWTHPSHTMAQGRMSPDEFWGLCGSPNTTCKLQIYVCISAQYFSEQVHGSRLIIKAAPDHRNVRSTGVKKYPQDLVKRRIQAQTLRSQPRCAGTD